MLASFDELIEFLQERPTLIYFSKDLPCRACSAVAKREGFKLFGWDYAHVRRDVPEFLEMLDEKNLLLGMDGVNEEVQAYARKKGIELFFLLNTFSISTLNYPFGVYVASKETLPGHDIPTHSQVHAFLKAIEELTGRDYTDDRELVPLLAAGHYEDTCDKPMNDFSRQVLEKHGGEEALNLSKLPLELALFDQPTISYNTDSDFERPGDLFDIKGSVLSWLEERGLVELVSLPTIGGGTLEDLRLYYNLIMHRMFDERPFSILVDYMPLKRRLRAFLKFADDVVPRLREEMSRPIRLYTYDIGLWSTSVGDERVCFLDTRWPGDSLFSYRRLLACLPSNSILIVRNPYHRRKSTFLVFSKGDLHAGIVSSISALASYKRIPKGLGSGKRRRGYWARRASSVPFGLVYFVLKSILEKQRGVTSVNCFCTYHAWLRNQPHLGFCLYSNDILFSLLIPSGIEKQPPSLSSARIEIKTPYYLEGSIPREARDEFDGFVAKLRESHPNLRVVRD